MEKYKPKSEEVSQAEEMQLPEQKEMSAEREKTYGRIRLNLEAKLHNTLDYLAHFHEKNPESLESQCQDRFGLSWEETKARVISDMESISLWNSAVRIGIVEEDIGISFNTGSGNWMTDPLVQLYFLKQSIEKESLDIHRNAHGFGGKFDKERKLDEIIKDIVDDPDYKISETEFYYIASALAPERIKQVLKIHGIEIRDLKVSAI